MNKPVEFIEFTLNGKTIAATPGETILDAAKRSRMPICRASSSCAWARATT